MHTLALLAAPLTRRPNLVSTRGVYGSRGSLEWGSDTVTPISNQAAVYYGFKGHCFITQNFCYRTTFGGVEEGGTKLLFNVVCYIANRQYLWIFHKHGKPITVELKDAPSNTSHSIFHSQETPWHCTTNEATVWRHCHVTIFCCFLSIVHTQHTACCMNV